MFTSLFHSNSGSPVNAQLPLSQRRIFLQSARDLEQTAGGKSYLTRVSFVDHTVSGLRVRVYRGGIGHSSNDGRAHIRFSADGGATWSDEDKTISGASVTGFPLSAVDAPNVACATVLELANGNLLILVNEYDFTEPPINGTTKGTRQWRCTNLTTTTCTFTDEGKAFDNGVLPVDDQYYFANAPVGSTLYCTVYGNTAPGAFAARLWKNSNNGDINSWEFVNDLGAGVNEVTPVWLGGTTLFFLLRDDPNVATYTKITTDLGVTIGAAVNVTAQIGLFHAGQGTFDSDTGRVWFTGRHYVNDSNEWLSVVYSDDQGVTLTRHHLLDRANVDSDNIWQMTKNVDGSWTLYSCELYNEHGIFELTFNFLGDNLPGGAWRKKCPVTIAASQVTGDLSNYVAYLNQMATGFPETIWSEAKSDGSDIRASTDSYGLNQIPVKVRNWNTGAQTGEIWIGPLDISSNYNITFYLWWGRPSATALTVNPWSAQPMCRIVQHCDYAPSGAGDQLDASLWQNHATATNIESGDIEAGTVGKRINLDGVNEYIQQTSSFNQQQECFEWVFVLDNQVDQEDVTNAGGYLGGVLGTGVPFIYFGSASENFTNETLSLVQGGGGVAMTNVLTAGVHHVALRWTGSVFAWYLDGAAATTIQSSGGNAFRPTGTRWQWGASVTNSGYFNGALDEVRVWKAAPPVDYIRTNYRFMFQQSATVSFGTVESGIP